MSPGRGSLHRLIARSADAARARQDPGTGAMPAGHNGPYGDPETPVRNTSHWLITFSAVARWTGEPRFREAADRAATYLLGDDARPMGGAFWHRKNPHKDACNGLIGQAWTIEALAEAGIGLDRADLIALAEEVFLLHPFDEAVGLWRCVSADGCYLEFDKTFNHQLWFAAAGGLLAPHADRQIARRVDRFMDRLEDNMAQYRTGLIKHPLTIRLPGRSRVRHLLARMREARVRERLRTKAEGYHTFNLYALAMLHGYRAGHAFWRSRCFAAAWRYARSRVFEAALPGNPYAYPYNPPGYEMAFALDVFEEDARAEQERWVAKQLRYAMDPETALPERGSEDPETYFARLYEATRLPDLAIPQTAGRDGRAVAASERTAAPRTHEPRV